MISIYKKGLIFALIFGSSLASAVEFDDFSSKVSQLELNGNAAKFNESLRVAPATWWQAGSAFTSKELKVAKFSTFFKFQISGPFSTCTGCGAGDGFTFAIQALSANAIGANGPAEGYGGELINGNFIGGINQSIAIEFDTYQNIPYNDPELPHIAILVNGDTRHFDSSLPVQEIMPSFNNGKTWYSWIDYDGEVLQVRLSQNDKRPKKALLEKEIDIAELLGVNPIIDGYKAFVGFTAATKGAYENHDILFWQYRESYMPIGESKK